MNDYILLMHNDAPDRFGSRAADWTAYFAKLNQAGLGPAALRALSL